MPHPETVKNAKIALVVGFTAAAITMTGGIVGLVVGFKKGVQAGHASNPITRDAIIFHFQDATEPSDFEAGSLYQALIEAREVQKEYKDHNPVIIQISRENLLPPKSTPSTVNSVLSAMNTPKEP